MLLGVTLSRTNSFTTARRNESWLLSKARAESHDKVQQAEEGGTGGQPDPASTGGDRRASSSLSLVACARLRDPARDQGSRPDHRRILAPMHRVLLEGDPVTVRHLAQFDSAAAVSTVPLLRGGHLT
jgi:hypothetical protein